ncbi:hypothetical protein D0469_09095 [Peribacillus saganii]|uniref:Uncharacterized protein n=2 Tax=Peribacillus saganii TaxID=2303992 RepID=A0A372LP31_9BACI|nr:hypothetical protein D0469_09095 [Peribacillus saganii]
MRTLIERVEEQLLSAKNLQARSVWRELYQKILKEEIVEAECRSGLTICFHCKNSHEQLALYDSDNGSVLHALLCNTCGREAVIYHAPETIPCPCCYTLVNAGPALSPELILQRKLAQCKVSMPTTLRETVLIAVGGQAISYLEPIKRDLPFSIVAIEKAKNPRDHYQCMRNVKKVFLQTSFEHDFEAELAILLVQQLRLMEVEVVTLIITPPIFEGHRRLGKVMEYVKELQKFSKETILLSGAALEKDFGSSVDLYKEHIPAHLRDILIAKGCHS